MKTFVINLLLIFSTTQLFSQQLTNEVIQGSWKVLDSKINIQFAGQIKNMDASQQIRMEQMRTAFIGAVFNFNVNNEFIIDFPDKNSEFAKELEFINHKKWKIINEAVIAIGTEEDNFSLMKITTGSKQDKNYFILEESPLVLEVIKL